MRMTCSLMSDRLCFTLLAITQASPNPWLIEFLYSTRGERPIEDTAHLWDTCSSIAVGVTTQTHTDTHSQPLSDCKMKLEELQYWHVMTSTGRQIRATYESIFLRTLCATVRREILTVQSQGHREKWSRRWRGVNMKKWLDAIKKR